MTGILGTLYGRVIRVPRVPEQRQVPRNACDPSLLFLIKKISIVVCAFHKKFHFRLGNQNQRKQIGRHEDQAIAIDGNAQGLA